MIETLFADYHEHQIVTAEEFARKNREYTERKEGLEREIRGLLTTAEAYEPDDLADQVETLAAALPDV